jgi:hypothetical protein
VADQHQHPGERADQAQAELVPARAESLALQRAAPRVRVTVSAILGHSGPDLSLASLADLARIDAFGVRVLRAAAANL